jgi:hypothetical protein
MDRPATIPTPENAAAGAEMRVLVPVAIRVVAVVLLAAAATALLVAFAGHPGWWRGWIAALVVSLAAALLSLAPVAAGILVGVQGMAYGYLAGAFVRVLVSIGGAVAAVWIFHTPPAPTLLLIVPLFFAQLLAESISLMRALNNRKPVSR